MELVKPKSINTKRALMYALADNMCLQEKIDGRRCTIVIEEGRLTSIGKDGTEFPTPTWLRESLNGVGDTVLDGELTKSAFHVFDLPADESTFLTERHLKLVSLARSLDTDRIKVVPLHIDVMEKLSLLITLRRRGSEGVVFRHQIMSSGRAFKYKFYSSVDAIVTQTMVDGKDAVAFGLLDKDNDIRHIGKCKVDRDVQRGFAPSKTVIEIRYLRSTWEEATESGSLVEPVFVRERKDKRAYTCTLDQIIPQEDIVFDTNTILKSILNMSEEEVIKAIEGEL